MAKATIDDVAALAGVSIKTVSRVVNGEPNVRTATREKVQQAVDKLGYHPSQSARRLASNRSFLIALLYDNPSPSYVIDVQNGILSECRPAGYDLLIHPCDHTDPELEQQVANLVRQSRVDGVVLTPPLSDNATLVRRIKEMQLPVVVIAPAEDLGLCSSVMTNDEEAAFALATKLLDKGHTQIGFILGHPDHKAMANRFKGFQKALMYQGVALDKRLVVQGMNSFESGYYAAEKLLLSATPPSAIFAANDDMAAGAIKLAHKLNRRIPADVAIAGFDDVPAAEQLWPGLTTVRQPIEGMARQAAQLLLMQLKSSDAPSQNQRLKSELIMRESV
ncbi:LacI family DNA-binding transcriptional regulator [Simiduia agarivorans]|uniref:LacI family transcriptional regulator n=1 Tax=Simiduia agarivorans (strain DSM 21679 / JCM 13881 / BCRC 17597 / SA1) TaxID=1117647 RepID=K4KPB6_SIMAS|nr:LacI family DNA-binding transcriptional regulator [Simiduia agarivorans]AFV01025.1 LacI family transcriptional regulator [Simiduia agarivorans SA1 = DSM 21679]